ncbi:golgi membrane, partial [Fusarium albosuccineum]
MSNYYSSQQPQYPGGGPSAAQNLQFFPSQYAPASVSGSATPQPGGYGYGNQAGYGAGAAQGFSGAGFGGQGVSGRM